MLSFARYHYSYARMNACRLSHLHSRHVEVFLYLRCDDRKGTYSAKVARISGYSIPLIDSAIKPPIMPIAFSILAFIPFLLFTLLCLFLRYLDRSKDIFSYATHAPLSRCTQRERNEFTKMISKWIVYFPFHNCSSYLVILFFAIIFLSFRCLPISLHPFPSLPLSSLCTFARHMSLPCASSRIATILVFPQSIMHLRCYDCLFCFV